MPGYGGSPTQQPKDYYGRPTRTTTTRSPRQVAPRMVQQQAIAPVYTPPPMTIEAQRDPYMDRYMTMMEGRAGIYDKFREELAEGTDRDAVNAMMRERDMTSGMAREAFEDRALQTGGATGLASRARTKVLTEGQASASRLSADMAASGRQAQLQALSGATSAIGQAGAMAGQANAALRAEQDFSLNTWQAARQAAEADQRMIAQRREQDWRQLMDLYDREITG